MSGWKIAQVRYDSTDNRNRDGHKASGDFSLSAASLSNRIIYSSDIELLGGNLVMDAVVPISYTDISTKNIGAASYSKDKSGVGDVILEPFILAWHGSWYDALVAAAVFLPTGDFNKNNPASIGKGYTTLMPSVGGTVYFDTEKTWHASILARYEMHTEQDQTHLTPGHDFHFEWGAGKKFGDIYNAGLVGYCHWQVTDDSGSGATSARKEVYAIGPEFNFAIPSYGTNIAVRVLKEFEAKNSPQGVLSVLTITKAFLGCALLQGHSARGRRSEPVAPGQGGGQCVRRPLHFKAQACRAGETGGRLRSDEAPDAAMPQERTLGAAPPPLRLSFCPALPASPVAPLAVLR